MKGLIISDIKFLANLYCFKKDEAFTFKPGLNILVGDQGAGKSTLIEGLVKVNKAIQVNVTKISDFIYFDTELHNPRSVKNLNTTFHRAATVGLSHFESHGETLLPFMLGITQFENRLIFLDEPESGLSIRSQIKVSKAIKKAIKNGNQLFISTHSQILMNMVDEVLSLEHRKWMTPAEFIESQYTKADLPKPKKEKTQKVKPTEEDDKQFLTRSPRKYTK